MKLTGTSVFCISLLLVEISLSLATKTGKGGVLKILKKPSKTKPTNTKFKESIQIKTKRPTQHNQGNYPKYPSGGYPQYPGHAAQDYMFGGFGNSPGSYINHNPNNRILSPHFGGSFGFGGYGDGGGSPFSHQIKTMGHAPSSESKGFGRSAAMAATRDAEAKMALGYGLGRFLRPHFHFHSRRQEYYYNFYVYKKYGIKSNDKNDYSRDYQYIQPPDAFDRYIESCMKRTDLLQGGNQTLGAAKPTIASVNTTTTTISVNTSSGANKGGSLTASPSTPQPLNSSEVGATKTPSALQNISEVGATKTPSSLQNISEVGATKTPSAPQNISEAGATTAPQILQVDDDDDTVSIVEIGYPALIKQMKMKRCIELYVVYADRNLKKKTVRFDKVSNSGVQGLKMDFQGLLSTLTITTLTLMNNNMLMLPN
ncbi:uncharacterized protein LOC108233590 [Kryptolebias marmoratus]|uniref:Uncharacterized LOC108233590 n=1 Tax=Kryptolebias marmoratus TaxID=37003 RepID=A0A3Q2ZK67_KRYMA|nr:uncharacterized protein LOC108233590 [Kryptolebias marmoratus]